ncbi:MAG: hypothetical protein CSA62_04115 [Planctomycetota bacterium]|nr:MAG: hypothetical protein CSA62_04115 [Planctomycetota bacterium]
MSEIQFREYQPGDEQAILDTFNLTFREVCGEGYVDRELSHWEWEFGQNPAGARMMLAFAPDGRCAAQYAATPMKVVLAGGKELSFFHAVDSMVHPEFRKGLSKRPIFVDMAERFFERYGGREDHLGFGYPVRPAWRIGERYLGYRLIRTLEYLLQNVGVAKAPSEVEVELSDRFPEQVDELFAELQPGFACTVEKSFVYLDWRYRRCPSIEYKILLARREGRLRGFAVVRSDGGLVPGAATIGDLLVGSDEPEILAALVAKAHEIARAAGCTQLLTVQNPELPWAEEFRSLGFEAEPSSHWLERKLGSRDWSSGLTQEWLGEHWYYQLGDSDLF